MPTPTANLDLTLPTPDVDTGWGSTLNTDFVKIDDVFDADGGGTAVGLNIGESKTIVVRGTLILGDGDQTNTTSAATIRGPERTGTNNVGSDIRFDAANGTGTGGSGDFIFRTAAPGSSGTTANTLANVFTIKNDGNIGIGASNPGNAVVVNRDTAVNTFVKTQNSVGSGYVGTADDGRMRLWADTSDGVSIGTNNIERIRIGDNGEFGISTTSGSTTTVSNGTSGQFLQSAGNNAQPTWASPSWNLAGIVQFNGGANADLTGLGSYGAIRITIVNMNPSAASQNLLLRFYDGSSYVSTNYTYRLGYSTFGTAAITYLVSTTSLNVPSAAYYPATNAALNGTLLVTNFNVAKPTGISGIINYYGTAYVDTTISGVQTASTAFSGVRLSMSGGATLSGGYMVVEGLTGP